MLSEMHIRWLVSRKIDPELATKCGVSSGTREGAQVTSDGRGNVLIFPFRENGKVVNEKYRGPNKDFSQLTGGKKTFFNAEVLDDPSLQDGRNALVITEGEPDCLAVMTAGYPFAVSVPDGSVPVPEGVDPDSVTDADYDVAETGKFAFLWNNREKLQKIKRFVIATDGDGPGRRMAAILVKHLQAARCARMLFPEGCKDANDILMRHGDKTVLEAILHAAEYPVRGLYDLTEFHDEEMQLYDIGIEDFSHRVKMFQGAFVVVTGPTNHGKSALAMEVAANMALNHRWKVAVFSPETRPVELRNQLRSLYLGGEWSRKGVDAADSWMKRHFKLILGDPVATGDRDEDITLQWLLDRAEDAVLRHNIDMLVVDPWNELEHARDKSESVTDYTGRAIRQMKRFARQYNVTIMICVHPTKDFTKMKDGKWRHVTLYDADGSSHWANKADIGIVVERDDAFANGAIIDVAKLRYTRYGLRGQVEMAFDPKRQRFVARNTAWAENSRRVA